MQIQVNPEDYELALESLTNSGSSLSTETQATSFASVSPNDTLPVSVKYDEQAEEIKKLIRKYVELLVNDVKKTYNAVGLMQLQDQNLAGWIDTINGGNGAGGGGSSAKGSGSGGGGFR